MLDKDFIFAFDLCNRMTHCPHDTMEQTAQSYRKRVPTFQLFIMLFFIYPKLWKPKGNSDYNRTRAEALTRPFHVQLSQKSVPYKFQVIKLQVSRTPQIHSMCNARDLHIWTGCLPSA